MFFSGVLALIVPAVICTALQVPPHVVLQSPNHNARLTNSEVANEGEVPFIAQLQDPISIPCHAVVLTDRWLLTTASCCVSHPVDSAVAYYGSVDINGTGVHASIALTTLHPNYHGNHQDNICVVQLNETIVFNDNVQPAALPSAPAEYGDVAILASWGNTYTTSSYEGTHILHIIRRAVIQTKEDCDKYDEVILATQRCVYPSNNANACTGEDSTPIAINNTVYGIMNIQQRYCTLGYPVSYLDLSAYIDFITEALGGDAKNLKIN